MSSKNGRSIRAIGGGGYGVCASTDGPTRPLVVVLGRRHANFTSNAIAEYHPGCVRPHSRLEYSRCKRRGFNKFKTRICSSTTIDTVVFCNAARVRFSLAVPRCGYHARRYGIVKPPHLVLVARLTARPDALIQFLLLDRAPRRV